MKPSTLGLLASLLMLCGGCNAKYGGLEVRTEGSVLGGDYADSRSVQIGVGHALRLHARPRSHTSETFDSPSAVELRSEDDSIARVFRDEEDEWRWIVVGTSVGSTCLEVVIDGSPEECISLMVRREPDPT